ncbi:nuclear transport factor 2 family protein [Nocardia sp. NPDC004123]
MNSELEDRENIRELHSRYTISVDERHHEAWARCFTEDGTFSSPLLGTHTGFENLKRFATSYHENLAGVQVRHIISNISVEIDGTNAVGWCYLSYYHTESGETHLAALGGYRDTLRKVNGQWLFSRRDVFLD